ncbi:MAG: PAS domain S-box protein [Sideroxyarcus sp.]|nr:PAS domain S-box protein [Sideroxyarcus sp.]
MVVLWSALLAGSLAWDMHQLKQDTLNAATVAARANINKDMNFRNWAASHGGVYVSPTEHTPPNPYLKVPERDVVTTTGKTLTLMNPAYMLREMQSDFPGDYGTRSHITSLKPINPSNAPDAWETKALHAFERGSKELLETQQIDGQPHLRMMLPFVVEQGCLKCHAQQGYKLGDIRGGISSAVPLAPFLARERESNTGMMLNHGAIWLLGLAGLAWLGVSFRRVQRLKILVRTAAAVEKSEQRFRAIAQSANDAIISADSAGKVVGWNQSAERLFGYAEVEIIGQPLTVLMPERFHNLHREGLARVVAGGTPHVIGKTVELAGLRKDGSEFPLEISLAQWQSTEGQFFTAIIRDITERKQTEQALQESEAELRALVEHSPIAMIVDVGVEADEKILMMNQQFTDLFGYTMEDVPDVRHWWPLAYPDEKYREELRAEWIGRVEKAIQSNGNIEPMEATVTCKDGSIRYVRASLASIGSRNIITFEDLTERKQAENSLRKLSLAVEQSPNSIVITDLDANIEYANAAFVKTTDYSLAEAIGQNPRILQSGKTPKASYDDLWAHLTRGEVWKGEFINRRKDGSEYIESVLISPVRQPDGRVTNYLAIKENITELKHVQEASRVSRESLHRLLNSMAEGAYGVDTNGDCTFVNRAFLQMLGYQNENEVMGKHIHELIHHSHADGSAYPENECRAYLAQSINVSDEVFWRKDGVAIQVEYWSYPIVSDGVVIGAIVTFIDITERKRAEAKLVEQLDELRRWHDATMGRETRVLDLKREVNELLGHAGQPPRYPSAESADQSEK